MVMEPGKKSALERTVIDLTRFVVDTACSELGITFQYKEKDIRRKMEMTELSEAQNVRDAGYTSLKNSMQNEKEHQKDLSEIGKGDHIENLLELEPTKEQPLKTESSNGNEEVNNTNETKERWLKGDNMLANHIVRPDHHVDDESCITDLEKKIQPQPFQNIIQNETDDDFRKVSSTFLKTVFHKDVGTEASNKCVTTEADNITNITNESTDPSDSYVDLHQSDALVVVRKLKQKTQHLVGLLKSNPELLKDDKLFERIVGYRSGERRELGDNICQSLLDAEEIPRPRYIYDFCNIGKETTTATETLIETKTTKQKKNLFKRLRSWFRKRCRCTHVTENCI